MALNAVYLDVEGALRTWTKSVVPSVSNRVFFGFPTSLIYPAILLTLIDSPPNSYLPDVQALIQYDVLGGPLDSGGSKTQAATSAMELFRAVTGLNPGTMMGDLKCLGAEVLAYRWLPVRETGQPRYTLDCLFDLVAI